MDSSTTGSDRDLKITGRFMLGLCIFHFMLLFCTAIGYVYASRMDHPREKAVNVN